MPNIINEEMKLREKGNLEGLLSENVTYSLSFCSLPWSSRIQKS